MKKKAISPSVFLACLICLFLATDCFVFAQGTPRINALFPAGGQVGTTVDVTVHGADLVDAHTLIIEGDTGITGSYSIPAEKLTRPIRRCLRRPARSATNCVPPATGQWLRRSGKRP